MNLNGFLIYFLILIYSAGSLCAQTKRFDTTVKMGTQGFHVECNNKAADQNEVSISPVGFKTVSRNPSFKVSGRVTNALSDDFNDDGLPDLAICIYNAGNNQTTIAAISYGTDKNPVPIYFPDIFLEPKLRDGYKGYDEFSVLTGTLLQKFPIYLPGDVPGKPSGGIRTIQYKAMADQGHLSFKVLRSFDVKQNNN